MSIKPRDSLGVPPIFFDDITDRERRIDGGAVFALGDVKAHVATLRNDGLAVATSKAAHDMNFTLRWQLSDVCNFISLLERRHYAGSQWCVGSGGAKRPYPADVYIMGYNRFSKQEIQQLDPRTYFKFSFIAAMNKIAIFSLHPEEK